MSQLVQAALYVLSFNNRREGGAAGWGIVLECRIDGFLRQASEFVLFSHLLEKR